jgi:hypothetical protein
MHFLTLSQIVGYPEHPKWKQKDLYELQGIKCF